MKSIIKYLSLALIAIALALAYSSRTIENMSLTSVTLARPYSGTISIHDQGFVPEIVRVRLKDKVFVEDIYIDIGDEINIGDSIVSVWPEYIDDEIKLLEHEKGDRYTYLCKIRDNGYKILSENKGTIVSVNVNIDTEYDKNTILYKYIPEGAIKESISVDVYDTIVPLSALTHNGKDKYIINFALPLTGKGESGQYIVLTSEVKVLATDGKIAALDINIWDDRQVILSSSKAIFHGQKVKAG